MSVAARIATAAAAHELRLCVVDVPLRALTNNLEVWRRLRLYFDPWVVAEAGAARATIRLVHGTGVREGEFTDVARVDGKPVKEAVRESGGVRLIWKRRTGVLMGLAPGEAFAVGDLHANLNQAINLVNNCYAKAVLDRGHTMLHASAVSWNDGAVALAGPPGAGKSTSALHLVEAGFSFLSNDRVLAKPTEHGVEALGYPKQPRVNPGTVFGHPRLARLLDRDDHAALARLDPQELWNLERKSDVDVDRIYGRGTTRLRGDLRALLLLRWTRDGGPLGTRRLTPAAALDAVPLIHKDLGVFDLDRPALAPRGGWDPGAYRALFERLPVVEVTGGVDFSALVPIVGDLLEVKAILRA